MPDQDEFDVEKLMAIVDEEQRAELEILQSLEFDWRKSPCIDHGVSRPTGRLTRMAITLPTGRVINLGRFYQFGTYSGMLCGLPNDPERYFIQAVNTAKQHFPNHEMAPVVLEPVIQSGLSPSRREGEEVHVPWLQLPMVCAIAEFDSDEPARDEHEVYSSVLAIWFQDHYGLPDDARTLAQLGKLDWEKYGYDWTP